MTQSSKKYRTVLSIAGSDSIGGAGIQADIKTCCAAGTYAMTAITAITAQNTTGVESFIATPPEMLKAQLRMILDDVRPDAVKIGMIPDAASAVIIADMLDRYALDNIVLDPVMVATSGDSLSETGTLDTLVSRLIPIATITTPNIPEAEIISGMSIKNEEDMIKVLKKIMKAYNPRSVLLKGGHMDAKGQKTDMLMINGDNMIHRLSHPYVDTPNTHGTGCSLSSAIASRLAIGHSLQEACSESCDWINKAIYNGKDYRTGHGHGPINHIFATIKY